MTVFTIVARFPTGEFNAHGEADAPEWPPAPARVVMALLAAAHQKGVGVAEVEKLFELEPPTVMAPAAYARDVGFSRWGPVNNELKVDKAGNPTGIIDRNDRFWDTAQIPPERGVFLGRSERDVVCWRFKGGDDVDLEILSQVACAVEYLGRPTSPVVLTVVEGEVEVPGTHQRWMPDPLGYFTLRVATPELLSALDRREERRRRSRVTGTHPLLEVRPTATYRVEVGAEAAAGEVGRLAGGEQRASALRSLLEGAALYRFPAGSGADHVVSAQEAATVVDQLRVLVPGLQWVLPVFGVVGRRSVPVLRGVLGRTDGLPPAVTVAVRSGVIQARAVEPRAMASLSRVVREATTAATEWTTVVPVAGSDPDLELRLTALAEELGAHVLWAGTHRQAGGCVGADVQEPTALRHVSMELDRPVSGPVVLEGVWMVPVSASRLAVNAKRPRNK